MTDDKRRILGRFFDMSRDMLCVANTDGYFVHLNSSWTQTLGWSEEELRAQPFVMFVHPDDQAATIAETGNLAGGGVTIRFENRYQCKDGTWKWILWSATLDSETGLIMALARDITDLREQADQLKDALHRAEQANHAKSAFLANMSHELRTPLNSVIGFANILRKNKHGHMNDKELSYTSRIADNGAHLLRLINDVLDLSKIEAGEMAFERKPVHLAELIDGVVSLLEPGAAAAGTVLRAKVPDRLQPVQADPHRLKQVLLNLAGNAIKFSKGGLVELVVRRRGDAPVAIEVRDNGIGIAADLLERVFQPFRQADESTARRFGGTGLGLPISRSLCDRMGFTLAATSTPGEGSTFTVQLVEGRPDDDDLQPITIEREMAKDLIGRSKLALVIDDDPSAVSDTSEGLRHAGLRSVTVQSGPDSLRVVRGLRPDVILLDVKNPSGRGAEILAQLRSDPLTKDIPIVIVSDVNKEQNPALEAADAAVPKEEAVNTLGNVLAPFLTSGPRTALLIDDDDDALTLMEEAVSAHVSTVVTARDGRAALDLLESGTIPDLIVSDLMMPNMDGFEFLDRLRDDPRFRDVPVLVVSARDLSDDDHARLKTTWPDHIIQKAGDTEDRVRELLESLDEA